MSEMYTVALKKLPNFTLVIHGDYGPTSKPDNSEDTKDKDFKPISSDVQIYRLINAPYTICPK